MNYETITLVSGRSLIAPNTTSNFKHCAGKSCKVLTQESIEQFGLFEVNAPNFNTYYPDVTKEDLAPKEDEFIYPKFRALTATSVRKQLPIDFSRVGVLKGATNKIKGVSIMTDHEQNVGNVLGAVKDAEWQEGYSVNGLKVPPGINVTLAIDGKSHPQVARGILMDPPAYHSVSVTVSYLWEWSHKLKGDQNPHSLWGTKMADGKILAKVVTNIVLFQEISIVPLGADPFARLLTDGKVTNPSFVKDRIALSASLSENGLLDKGYVSFLNQDSYSNEFKTFINQDNNDDMNLSELMESLSLDKATTADQLIEMFISLKADASTLATLLAKKEDLNASILQELLDNQTSEEDAAILTFVEENEGQENLAAAVEFQTNALKAKRTGAINMYKLVQGDKANEAIIKNIEESNGETLDGFLEQYTQEYNESVPLTCASCGSTDVSRKASKKEEFGEPISLRDKLLAKKREEAIHRIHGDITE